MLTLFRNTGESIAIKNEKTGVTHHVKLTSHNFPICTLEINGELHVKKIPESFEVDACMVTVLSIDRGVKFGLVAPQYIKLNRV